MSNKKIAFLTFIVTLIGVVVAAISAFNSKSEYEKSIIVINGDQSSSGEKSPLIKNNKGGISIEYN